MESMMDGMVLTGAVTLKVSEETFLIDEHQTKHEANLEMVGMKIESIDDGIYTFTYNNVDSIQIPAGIIENTKEINFQHKNNRMTSDL